MSLNSIVNPVLGLFGLNERPFNVVIMFKSGNRVVADKVTEFEIRTRGNRVTSLTLRQKAHPKNKVLVGSLDLSQIEAAVRVN